MLQTTITEHLEDWDITRISLLADELRAAGHEMIARNRVNRGSAAKAALEALTRPWAAEFGSREVQVNSVAPGPTRTDRVAAEWDETYEERGRALPWPHRPIRRDRPGGALSRLATLKL